MVNPFRKIADFIMRKTYMSLGQSLVFGDTVAKPTNKDYLDAFEASFLVFACVSKIAKKVANTKFKLYKVGGRAGSEKITEQTNHPILDLLAQVNPFTTKFAMLDLTQTYQELLGNSYWLKVRGENSKKPLELWALRPDWITIKNDEKNFIKNYEYRMPNGVTQNFEPKDIIHFKQVNPKSALYGLPTIKAAMDVVRTSIYATRWNMNFFNNSAIPDTIMVTKTKMSPEEKTEFREKWEDKYQGVKNAHKLGILGGEVEFKQIMMSLKDMEFSKLTETTTQQILTAFGVPKAILGLQGMNRAEAEAQIYAFLSETIEPKIRAMVEILNEFLVPEFGDNLYLDFVDPTPANREAQIKEYESALKNNWLLINEVRDREGLPPVEGGWSLYLPMMMMPIGELKEGQKAAQLIKVGGIKPKKYYADKREREQEKLREKVLAGKRSLKLKMQLKEELVKCFIRTTPKKLNKKQREKRWQEHNKMLISDEKLFVVLARRLFKKQEERVQEALESDRTGKAIRKDVEIDWDLETVVFIEMSIPIFTDIIQRRGQVAMGHLGIGEFEMTKQVQKFIKRKAFKFSKEVNRTTKKKLGKTLSEGIKDGESIDELSKRVSGVFKIRRGAESERIARTEVLSASNEATLEAYEQSGVVEGKEWLATMDADTRDWHAVMNGEGSDGSVKLRDQFSNGLMFPGDPSGAPDEVINCRCTMLSVSSAE